MTTKIATAALAFFLAVPAIGAAAAPPSQASTLLGTTVVDARNKRLGVVTDLVVDLENKQIVGLQVGRATAEGMAHDVYAWPSVKLAGDKVVLNGRPTGQEMAPEQSLAKILHAPLRDAEGKNAGEISDVMVGFDDAQVASFIIRFDPKWLDMSAPAAVPLSSLARKDDGFLVKFSASDVRPAGGQKAAPAPPPPPPPLQRARLSQLAGDAATNAFAKAPANLETARRLLGARFVNQSGDVVGKVEDVIVDTATGKLDAVVGSFKDEWVAPGWIVVLPVRPLAADKSGNPAVRMTLDEINHAFLFEAKSWPDFSHPAVNAAIHAKIDHM